MLRSPKSVSSCDLQRYCVRTVTQFVQKSGTSGAMEAGDAMENRWRDGEPVARWRTGCALLIFILISFCTDGRIVLVTL